MALSRITNPFLSSSGAGNAGITSPSANTIAFSTTTAERMRIDSSGNLGIGTSSPLSTSQLTVASKSLSVTGSDGNFNAGGTRTFVDLAGTLGRVGVLDGGAASGTSLAFFTGGGSSTNGERMRIDSSGNVGIGTSSPGYKLDVQSSASSGAPLMANFQSAGGDPQLYISNGTVKTQLTADATNSASIVGSFSNHPLIIRTNNTERARFDTSGNLLVGTTDSNSSTFKFKVQPSSGYCFATRAANSSGAGTGIVFDFINDGNSVNIPFDIRASGIYCSQGIGTTGSAANAYFNAGASNQFLRSTSALKYKTDIRDLESIDILKFRPVRYKSLCEADDKTKDHFGVIADEVHAAGIKELVTYGVDEEIEGFQYERLTVVLLKAIQEQQALIQSLTDRITALESK